MHDYRYKISLRIFQKFFTTARISSRLGLRNTPSRGQKDSSDDYWRSVLADTNSTNASLETALRQITDYLDERIDFLREIGEHGGRVELLIGVFSNRNHRFELMPTMTYRLSIAGVVIVFDMYPDAPPA